MTKRKLRFNPEYQDENGKWKSLKPENIDLIENNEYKFFIQDVDKNTDLTYSQKIVLKLDCKISKA